MRLLTVITQPRLFIVTLLGFSSGLPLALTGATLQAWYTQAGISLMTIGLLSYVGMPYLWKPLWSPVLDRFTPPWGGRRRGWIAMTQLGLCITLFVLASLNPGAHPIGVGLLALVIAFISASQDIGIDAYRTEILQAEERGLATAAFIFAYRIAMLVAGGFSLVLADHLGWQATYEIMAVLMGLSILITYQAQEPQDVSPPKTFYAAVTEPFLDLWNREKIGLILLFIILYKIGDALALQLVYPFLLKLGFSLTTLGFSYKTLGLLATISGGFVGGAFLASINIYRALWIFGLAQAFSNLMFVILASVGKNLMVMLSAVFIENFCSGMSTAALVVFLMSLCQPRYTATQFACLSALASIGRVVLGPVAAYMVATLGWINFYWCAFVLSFPGIILLVFLQGRVQFNEALAQK